MIQYVKYIRINGTIWKFCSVVVIFNGPTVGFHPQTPKF